MATNNTQNVSTGKGVAGGYFYTAPVGTPLPSDFSSDLNSAFVNCGFLSDEGITNSTDADNQTYKDLNGDDVLTAYAGRTRTISLQFIELNEQSLKEVYGQGNVDVSGDMITVTHDNDDPEHRSLVMELLLRDGRRWRRVVEDAQISDWENVTVVSSDLVNLGVAYTLNKGNTTDAYIKDYIEPTASVNPSVSGGRSVKSGTATTDGK